MTDETATDEAESRGRSMTGLGEQLEAGRFAAVTDRFVHFVELAAAAVFALLFAIGVLDLALQILDAVRRGAITDPLVVIGFVDTGLLLIVVEVSQTVVAYTRETDTRRIVRLVVYTGVIATVRTAVFRTAEFRLHWTPLRGAVVRGRHLRAGGAAVRRAAVRVETILKVPTAAIT